MGTNRIPRCGRAEEWAWTQSPADDSPRLKAAGRNPRQSDMYSGQREAPSAGQTPSSCGGGYLLWLAALGTEDLGFLWLQEGEEEGRLVLISWHQGAAPGSNCRAAWGRCCSLFLRGRQCSPCVQWRSGRARWDAKAQTGLGESLSSFKLDLPTMGNEGSPKCRKPLYPLKTFQRQVGTCCYFISRAGLFTITLFHRRGKRAVNWLWQELQ